MGVSQVLGFNAWGIGSQLRELDQSKIILAASGDSVSQRAISRLFRPNGRRVASTLGEQVNVLGYVERIYGIFEGMPQAPKYEEVLLW